MRPGSVLAVAVTLLGGLAVGCGPKPLELPPEGVPPCAEKGDSYGLTVEGWDDREYDIHLPPQYDCMNYTPLVIALHGNGGNKESMARTTCPAEYGGIGRMPRDPGGKGCLNHLADQKNFMVVYPNASPISDAPVRDARAWNAGGGGDGYRCIHPATCRAGVDDVEFIKDLLDTVQSRFDFDKRRVYVTGLSDGGAMAYRLACELSDRITAIAPIAAGNQFAAGGQCTPKRAVPLLHVHGADDPVWPYAGGSGEGRTDGKYVSVCETVLGSASCAPTERTSERTFAGWKGRNHCSGPPRETPWDPNPNDDRTRVTHVVAGGCPPGAEVGLLRIDGGGHTWPGGWQYYAEKQRGVVPGIGATSREFSANEVIWAFFERQSKKY